MHFKIRPKSCGLCSCFRVRGFLRTTYATNANSYYHLPLYIKNETFNESIVCVFVAVALKL